MDIVSIIKAVIIIVFGLLAAKFTRKHSQKLISRYVSIQQTVLLEKILYFLILMLFTAAALQQVGFKLSILLGSAGILTAALAFASQTSISNIISGLFLVLEKSLHVGDRIKVGDTTGTIIAIDLLSVKIITAANTLVRIPNETIIKSEITNITRFDHRRIDIAVTITYQEDLERVKRLLLEIVQQQPLCLKDPAPKVILQEFTENGIALQLFAWSSREHADEIKDRLLSEIKVAFEKHHIEFPSTTKFILSPQ